MRAFTAPEVDFRRLRWDMDGLEELGSLSRPSLVKGKGVETGEGCCLFLGMFRELRPRDCQVECSRRRSMALRLLGRQREATFGLGKKETRRKRGPQCLGGFSFIFPWAFLSPGMTRVWWLDPEGGCGGEKGRRGAGAGFEVK